MISRSIFRILLTASFGVSLLPACALAEDLTVEQAIERILRNNPQVDVYNAAVDEAQGTVTTAKGDFDWALTTDLSTSRDKAPNFSATTGEEYETLTRADEVALGASKMFQNSWSLTVANTVSRTRLKNALYGPVGANEVSATLEIPLLKGAGTESATADLRQANETLSSTRLSSNHSITELVYTGMIGYWTSLALERNIQVLDETMQRARDLANLLVARVDGGELASVDYERSLAELRLREIDVLDALQSADEAQRNLGVTLGITTEGQAPTLVTNFPEPVSAEVLSNLKGESLVTLAMDNRLDLKSLVKSRAAQTIALTEAERDLLPELNLELTAGYASAIEQYSASALDDLYFKRKEINGPNYAGKVTFSYPLGNNAASGQEASERASLRQINGNIASLKNTIRSEVLTALSKLKNSLNQLGKAQESNTLLENVSAETQRKLNQGEATMTDVVSVEDRLASSRLQIIAAQNTYAQALADLRYATGTLASEKGSGLQFDAVALRTLPLADAPQAKP